MSTYLALDIAADCCRAGTATIRAHAAPAAGVQGAHVECAGVLDPGPQTVDDFHKARAHLILEVLRLGQHLLGRSIDAALGLADRTASFAARASQVAAVPYALVVGAARGFGVAR